MAGVLAAEDRVGFGHRGLDERVTDAGAYRMAAVLAHDLWHGPRRNEAMDDRRSRLLGKLTNGDERRQDRGRNHVAVLVDDETAVRVTVEREADVRLGFAHLRL